MFVMQAKGKNTQFQYTVQNLSKVLYIALFSTIDRLHDEMMSVVVKQDRQDKGSVDLSARNNSIQ